MRDEGTADRALCGIAGLGFSAAALAADLGSAAFPIASAAGIVLLVTALTGFCPVRRLPGANTCGAR